MSMGRIVLGPNCPGRIVLALIVRGPNCPGFHVGHVFSFLSEHKCSEDVSVS